MAETMSHNPWRIPQDVFRLMAPYQARWSHENYAVNRQMDFIMDVPMGDLIFLIGEWKKSGQDYGSKQWNIMLDQFNRVRKLIQDLIRSFPGGQTVFLRIWRVHSMYLKPLWDFKMFLNMATLKNYGIAFRRSFFKKPGYRFGGVAVEDPRIPARGPMHLHFPDIHRPLHF